MKKHTRTLLFSEVTATPLRGTITVVLMVPVLDRKKKSVLNPKFAYSVARAQMLFILNRDLRRQEIFIREL